MVNVEKKLINDWKKYVRTGKSIYFFLIIYILVVMYILSLINSHPDWVTFSPNRIVMINGQPLYASCNGITDVIPCNPDYKTLSFKEAIEKPGAFCPNSRLVSEVKPCNVIYSEPPLAYRIYSWQLRWGHSVRLLAWGFILTWLWMNRAGIQKILKNLQEIKDD